MFDSIRSRRQFLKASAVTAAGVMLPEWSLTGGAPAIVAAESDRPQALQGLHFGDPHDGSIVVWSRSDRSARMLVDWSYDEQFRDAQRIRGPHALETSDFTARQAIDGLEPGSDVFVRVSFQSLANDRAVGEPVIGRFVVPPDPLGDDDRDGRDGRRGRPDHGGRLRGDLRFVWGGDTAGQGWGINPAFGGMKIYEAMRQRSPLFFVHSGDNIYA
ncbi:MAG TPA: PhoD-like phosphatase N-terminal domain-containing protein, partial [Vicinamibacterales bacterium]|nr:PhoD-like phosphatase N-terminal domain-containing protein [Vicinamibacterales bacterium]